MIEIVPSILSADFARLADEISKVERGGAKILHLDVMDGHFVPNLTIGPPVVESIRKVTKLHLDCHLMIENPDRYAGGFRGGRGQFGVGALRGLPASGRDPADSSARAGRWREWCSIRPRRSRFWKMYWKWRTTCF